MRAALFLWVILATGVQGQPSFNMTLLSNLDLSGLPTRFGSEYNDCWGFRHANGTEIAILGGIEDIFFVNVTNPANPQIIYTHDVTNVVGGTTNQSLWRDFKTYQNYAYAAADEGTSGLLIFDLSQVPNSVTMVKQTNAFWNRAHNIYIDEENGRLYAAGSNTVNAGLVILNLASSPADPTLAGNVPLNAFGGGYVHDVHVRDHIAYCSHGSLSKIQIYDFSNLPNVSIVGTIENYPDVGYNHSSWLNGPGDKLVMCDETHGSDVKLVDISDIANISADDFYTFYSELLGPGAPGDPVAHNPFILGDLVFIAYYHDGVQVFDISDPEDITRLAYYDTYPTNTGYSGYEGCWGVYPFLPSNIIIASDQNFGLYVMEITEGTLDIEFLFFKASRKEEGVWLDWTVADASFGHTFEILRSADGGKTFTAVGKSQLEEGQSRYTYMDAGAEPTSRYMYRIDFLQLDGSRIHSPLQYVRAKSGDVTIRAVNPITQQSLVLDFLRPVDDMHLQLYDLEGRPVWSADVDTSSPRMEFSIDNLPAGHYILQANWAGGSENLVLQKS